MEQRSFFGLSEPLERLSQIGDPPGVTYLYAPDRKAEQPIRHLQGKRCPVGTFPGAL
jgi:hypothetical protein